MCFASQVPATADPAAKELFPVPEQPTITMLTLLLRRITPSG